MSAAGNQLGPAYVPVPVEAAAELGKRYKDIVVICAWDAAHGTLLTTTWGASPLDKHHAAVGGELCAKALRADFDDRYPRSPTRALPGAAAMNPTTGKERELHT